MRPKHTKPFYHTPSSSMFRLACRIEFMSEEKIFPEMEKFIIASKKLKEYANNLKSKMRRRVLHVRGKRRSIERIINVPFKKVSARIVYGIAIDIEKMLTKHYQLKSGETYVVLSKAAARLHEAIEQRVQAVSSTATMKIKGEGDER